MDNCVWIFVVRELQFKIKFQWSPDQTRLSRFNDNNNNNNPKYFIYTINTNRKSGSHIIIVVIFKYRGCIHSIWSLNESRKFDNIICIKNCCRTILHYYKYIYRYLDTKRSYCNSYNCGLFQQAYFSHILIQIPWIRSESSCNHSLCIQYAILFNFPNNSVGISMQTNSIFPFSERVVLLQQCEQC